MGQVTWFDLDALMPAYEYLLDILKLETQGGVPVVDERDSEGEHHSKVRRCVDAWYTV